MIKNIQEMNIFDLNKVVRIEKLSFKDDWSFDSFIYELLVNDKASYYVYKDKENILGYIGIWKLDDEIHITNLAVDPIFRKKGIATQLIEYIIKIGKDCNISKITLEVRISNNNAIKLYKKLGFESGKNLKDYYKIEDGIEMVLKNN